MNRLALDHRRTSIEEAGTHFRATRTTTVVLRQDLELDHRITPTAIILVDSIGRHVKMVLSTDHRRILVDPQTFRIDQEWDSNKGSNNRAAGGQGTLIIRILVTVQFQGSPSWVVHKVLLQQCVARVLDQTPDRMVHQSQ